MNSETIIRFAESDLSEAGRRLLALVRGQSSHLAALLEAKAGRVYAVLDDGGVDSDDAVVVWVTDSLSFTERARRFGVAGLPPHAQRTPPEFGAPDPDGERFPLPTEEYIASVERFYAGASAPGRRRWEPPAAIVRQVRRGELSGAAAWNALADAFFAWCQAGGFAAWRNPDWITQTEAAARAGVPLTTIRNAVRDGRLTSWTDPEEPNPQRATRVDAEEVERHWPPFLDDDSEA